MENEFKKLITKDNVQSLAMVGLLIVSLQVLFLLIKLTFNKKIS